MRVHKRQPRTSAPVTQKSRLDIPRFKLPFEEDVILEEDHRRSDVVRHPPELLNRILLFIGEGIRDIEGDFEVENRVWKLRLPWRRIWTVENFGWHVVIDVVDRGETDQEGMCISEPQFDSYTLVIIDLVEPRHPKRHWLSDVRGDDD